jgi:hypothetical protein
VVGDLGDLPEDGPQVSLCETLFGVFGQLKVILPWFCYGFCHGKDDIKP